MKFRKMCMLYLAKEVNFNLIHLMYAKGIKKVRSIREAFNKIKLWPQTCWNIYFSAFFLDFLVFKLLFSLFVCLFGDNWINDCTWNVINWRQRFGPDVQDKRNTLYMLYAVIVNTFYCDFVNSQFVSVNGLRLFMFS